MKKNKINIRFVQLEPAAFLSDRDMLTWNSNEIGCYWMILLCLYTNNGKAPNDLKALARICHCHHHFKRIWDKIGHRFTIIGQDLSHKRVSLELKRASERFEKIHLAGSKGGKTRWQRHGDANSDAMPREGKGSEVEEKRIKTSNSKQVGENANGGIHTGISQDTISTSKINSSFSTSVRNKENPFQKAMDVLKNRVGSGACEKVKPAMSADSQTMILQFSEKLNAVIRPRTQSDRTCFRNVANFFGGQIAAGKCGAEVFTRALHLAEEAAKGRNPAACFMALVKKELNYR